MQQNSVRERAGKLIDTIQTVILAERRKLELLLATKIAGGHIILADFHGVGKTSLARAFAGAIEWEEGDVSRDRLSIDPFSRVQCTVDLLPQDIIGYTRVEGDISNLVFHKGPIFAHFVLCDEINLLTPKTQGSFFQAMEERTITAEGVTYELPAPFFIIATMNLEGAHLFPLPAPQLDRFMVQISLGFPGAENEKNIIRQHGLLNAWDNYRPAVTAGEIINWQKLVDTVQIHDDVIDYIVRFVRATRENSRIKIPASPRAGVKISRLARAVCLLRDQPYVTVDTVKELIIPALAHRLEPTDPEDDAERIVADMMEHVPVHPRR